MKVFELARKLVDDLDFLAGLRLLADRLVELEVVETVSYETVRQTLKQTFSSRG